MQLEMTHSYDASLDRVLGTFFDEQHILEKNALLGSRNVRVAERRLDDQSGKLVVEREMTTSVEVPGMLSAFHQEWNRIRQEEHWLRKDRNEWHCEFRVRIDGVPAHIRGIMRLQGTREACTNQVTLDVRCDVPLLGKKIAGFLIEDSRHKIEQEYGAMREML